MTQAFGATAPKQGQVPSSFADLFSWLDKPGNAQRLGEDRVPLIKDAEWFFDIRRVRDKLVHMGAESMVFPVEGRIVFQTYERSWENVINNPLMMFNKNLVDFEAYAGFYLGRVIFFLLRLAPMLIARAQQEPLKVGFLGPEGTFTQAAVLKHFGHSVRALPLGAPSGESKPLALSMPPTRP